jgi:hypothetical protein
VRLGDRWLTGRASDVEGTADDELARTLLATKYQGWSDGQRAAVARRDRAFCGPE